MGKIAGRPNAAGNVQIYDVVTYGSDTLGIAYYDLKVRPGERHNYLSQVGKNVLNTLDDSLKRVKDMPPIFLPGPRQWPTKPW